jgi:hypothetical protein
LIPVRRLSHAVLVMLAAAGGCRAVDPTEIVVQVDTDLRLDPTGGPVEIDAVRLRVLRVLGERDAAVAALDAGAADAMLDDGGAEADAGPAPDGGATGDDAGDGPSGIDACTEEDTPERTASIDYSRRFACTYPVADLPRLPLTLGVVPRGDVHTRIEVEAIGLLRGVPVVRDRARTLFQRGRVVYVSLFLGRLCSGVECPPELVCRHGECGPVEVPAECLGTRIDPWACEADGGLDGVDGAPPDARGDDDAGEAPDAGSGCACAAGATDTRQVACGNCGSGAQDQQRACGADCTWGGWGDVGGCVGAGGCRPGNTQTRTVSCGNCSTGTQDQARTCDDECNWAGWSATSGCVGGGTCSPGATMTDTYPACGCTETADYVCSSSCRWTETSCDSTCRPSCC